MNRPDLAVANSARAEANLVRAKALIEVAQGHRTITDVVTAAAGDHEKALLRLTVRQLLLAQPGWGEERTRQVISKITDIVGQTPDHMTVAWILDPRAAGRRFMAFCDAITSNTQPPWPGYPFAKKPTHTHSTGSAA